MADPSRHFILQSERQASGKTSFVNVIASGQVSVLFFLIYFARLTQRIVE